MCFPCTGLPDLANNLQCLRHAYTKKLFTVYLKFKFTLASCVFSVSNPMASCQFLWVFAQMSLSWGGLLWTYYDNFQLPSSTPVFVTLLFYFYTWHSLPSIRVHILLICLFSVSFSPCKQHEGGDFHICIQLLSQCFVLRTIPQVI